jgi:predicted enzyme related to lactoylglutathione lyase
MPIRDPIPAGAPCWADLATSDPSRAVQFYRQVFRWEAEEPDPAHGGYFNFHRDGVRLAGAMKAMQDGPADVWSGHLATDNVEKTLEVVAAEGGQVIVPAMEVSDLGVMSIVVDPGGASIGFWQPGTHRGFGLSAEDGAVSWFELHTREYRRCLEFYGAVTGAEVATMADEEGFRYSTLVVNGRPVAGIMDASGQPTGHHAGWDIYFWAEDADTVIGRIRASGGKIVRPAEDTPYGRLAEATDPMGARFKLMAANDQMPATR